MTSPVHSRDRRALRRELAVTARWLRELRAAAKQGGPAVALDAATMQRARPA